MTNPLEKLALSVAARVEGMNLLAATNFYTPKHHNFPSLPACG